MRGSLTFVYEGVSSLIPGLTTPSLYFLESMPQGSPVHVKPLHVGARAYPPGAAPALYYDIYEPDFTGGDAPSGKGDRSAGRTQGSPLHVDMQGRGKPCPCITRPSYSYTALQARLRAISRDSYRTCGHVTCYRAAPARLWTVNAAHRL